MYEINLEDKKPKELEIVNFSDLELKEEFDIEVGITENPSILKEELLIISEQLRLLSNRLPDLLALDKENNNILNRMPMKNIFIIWGGDTNYI